MPRTAAVLLTLLAAALIDRPVVARTDRPPGVSASPLTSLQRLVRHFDFDDLERRPMPLPDHFHRVGGHDDADGGGGSQGFPPFGVMRLVDDVAASGSGSFAFLLDGGSMAARTPTAVIPVLPDRQYLVRTLVRTEGLVHAAARLEAWLHDANGEVIHAGRVQSRPARTGGGWDVLEVEVTTGHDAADLVVELQVLQPRQQGHAGAANAGRPVMEDRRGRVWFDDLAVWNVPRVEVETPAPGNVITSPDDALLRIRVHDLAAERLRGEIVLRNVDGGVAHASRFAPGPGGRPHVVDLSHLTAGWYESQVELSESGTIVARRKMRLHVAAPRTHPSDPKFGVAISAPNAPDATLATALGVGTAVVTVGDVPSELAHEAHGEPVTDQLLLNGVHTTLAIRAEAVDAPTTEIERIVRRFGHQVRRWQLGTVDDLAHGAIAPATPAWLEALTETWADGAEAITLLRPWSAEFEAGSRERRGGLHVTVPYAVAPDTLETLVPTWTRPDADLVVTLEQPPAGMYDPRSEVEDLSRRTLHAWRAGRPGLLIETPWSAGTDAATPEPTPAFGVWRTLADRLTGRRFIAALPMGDAVHAWLIEGVNGRDAALVAWTDDPSRGDHLHMELGADRVWTVDIYGNVRTVEHSGEGHVVALSETPVFIEGVDARLARFRVAFMIDPPSVQSAHRVQERAIILTNPWEVPLTGSARVADGDRWRADLTETAFRIAPGETLRLPVTITPRRNVLAGPKTVRCELHMQADRTYHVTAAATIDVGLDHLEVVPRWRLETRDGQRTLLVEVTVRNTGTRVSSVEAFVFAPGMSIERRPIGRLAPGQTAARIFRLGSMAAGATAYVGVDETEGAARLTRAIRLPQVSAGGGLAVH